MMDQMAEFSKKLDLVTSTLDSRQKSVAMSCSQPQAMDPGPPGNQINE